MAGVEALKAADGIIRAAFNVCQRCILFYSGGKDSTVALHLIERVYRKKDIELVFMPYVDGLAETDAVITMAKKQGYSGVHLYQHWGVFQGQGKRCVLHKTGQAKKT